MLQERLPQALQIIFGLQSRQKKSSKENTIFRIAKRGFFFIFLHFDPSYFISA